jgi:hypothetical protein
MFEDHLPRAAAILRYVHLPLVLVLAIWFLGVTGFLRERHNMVLVHLVELEPVHLELMLELSVAAATVLSPYGGGGIVLEALATETTKKVQHIRIRGGLEDVFELVI